MARRTDPSQSSRQQSPGHPYATSQVLKVYRPPPNPPLSEFIQPELKLAGLRLDPAQASRSRLGHSLSVTLLDYDLESTTDFISDLPESPLQNIPDGYVLNYLRWSPTGKRIAFTLRSLGGPGDPPRAPLALWTADIPQMQARPVLGDRRLNATYEDFVWLDDDTLVASVIPEDRGDAPAEPAIPVGPKISDNSSGSKSQARTYPDLLKVRTRIPRRRACVHMHEHHAWGFRPALRPAASAPVHSLITPPMEPRSPRGSAIVHPAVLRTRSSSAGSVNARVAWGWKVHEPELLYSTALRQTAAHRNAVALSRGPSAAGREVGVK